MTETAPHTTFAPLQALLTQTAFAPLPSLGWLKITGEDRVRWLNGMVTNSVQALKPGEGCYNFFLNAQGRIQGDGTAFLQDDAILLETSADRLESLREMLDRFIIMDDVELQPLENRAGLLVAGPAAEALLTKLSLGVPDEPLRMELSSFDGEPVMILHGYSPLVPRFEIWSDPATIGLVSESLRHAGAVEVSDVDLEQLRLLEGTPRYGVDIRDKDLAQETNQTRALHFSKGCYLGQEIVERVRSRGQVHRTFAAFTLSGEAPPAGTPISSTDAPDRPVGEITSAATIPLAAGPVTLALGYIRREFLERNSPLTYPGRERNACDDSLPYLIRSAFVRIPSTLKKQESRE